MMNTNAGNAGSIRKKRWEKDHILNEIENQNRVKEQEKIPRQQVLRDLSWALRIRVVQFFFFYLSVSLFLYAQDGGDENSGITKLQEIYPLEIFTFAAAVFFINAATTCLDHALFYSVEVVWTGHYDVVYYAYSLHGAFGHILSLLLVINFLSSMSVLQKLGSLHAFTTACLVVALCYSLKEFYLRRHYKNLLKVRLKDKLARMKDWGSILSMLSLAQINPEEDEEGPPEMDGTQGEGNDISHRRNSSSTCKSDGETFNPMVQRDGNPSQQPFHVQSGEGDSRRSDEFNKDHRSDSCCQYNSYNCCFCPHHKSAAGDQNHYGTHSTLTSDDAESNLQLEEQRHEKKIHLSFWKQLEDLRNGHLKVSSRFGYTTIRSRKQAEAFGNRLYMHLTNGNTKTFTGEDVNNILREAQAQHHSDYLKPEALPFVCHPLTPDRFSNSNADIGGPTDIVCLALRLFRCNESLIQKPNQATSSGTQPSVISQSVVVNAVVTVFSECQFSRASLRDLHNLHETAKSVVDFIFSVFMLLLVQIILKVDVSKVIAPLLTILFGLSFAFSPVLSNLFLSMAFVMFLLPFNVGNRVIIGRTDKIKGNVFEMSLMNTTILTRHNEKLRIPNHQLFYEHITNLSEGMVSTFEIPVVFALDGPLVCSQEKIHAFIRQIKKFAKEDNKAEWIDVIVFCDELNYGNNQVKYTFWCTHRAGYHEVIRCYNGHTRMLEEMRRVQVELDIHLQKALKIL